MDRSLDDGLSGRGPRPARPAPASTSSPQVGELLNYLNDDAGFAIAIKPNVPLDRTSVRTMGRPQNEEQALLQLERAVADIGCTVLRKGHLLTIITMQEAKKHWVPLPRLAT